jgi:pyridoxal phosphate enzyme (YggS family)
MFRIHDRYTPVLTIDQALTSCKMNNLKVNLHNVRSRVNAACKRAGRDSREVAILAVSKKHTVERILALREFGQTSFGESYVQEALMKINQLSERSDTVKNEAREMEWHFIGPLQSNKTRDVAQNFSWVQSVDRIKLLQRLSSQRPDHLPELNICIQVNIDNEPQKAGVLPDQLPALVEAALRLPRLRLRGLMAIPRAASADHDPSGSHEHMASLFHGLIQDGINLDILSMGMSADLEAAIMHGSTMVRIGTDLFGPRPPENGNQT